MIVVEALFMTNLAAVLALSSYSDCRKSIIHNRQLLVCGVIALLLDILYYVFWAKEFFTLFAANSLLLITIGCILYAYNIWAAGDSKLLIVVVLSIPGRFYTFSGHGWGVSFYLIAFVFSIAFIYVVIESLVRSIKDKQLFKITFGRIDWKRALFSYLAMAGTLSLIKECTILLFPDLLSDATYLFVAVDFLLVLTMLRIREKLSNKSMIIVSTVVWAALIVLAVIVKKQVHFSGSLTSWMIVLLIMLLRLLTDKYNYKVIPTQEVQPGFILSASTVLCFSASRIQGLPSGKTEDLRSRLTAAEAESVKRWGDSAKGQEYIIIVRKIPFAIFISIGTLAFIIFELVIA